MKPVALLCAALVALVIYGLAVSVLNAFYTYLKFAKLLERESRG